MDTYGHLFPDSEEIGRGAIDAMLAPADVRPMCAMESSWTRARRSEAC
jgi:hypothetical protein